MNRLGAIIILLAGIFLVAGTSARASDPMSDKAPAGYFVFQKVVYQNSGGLPDNRAYFEQLMRNLGAHIAATEGHVEIRVVSFGPGVKAFQTAKTDPALAESIDSLRKRGVRFLICRNTLKAMGLGIDDLYNVAADDIVISGVAELARLQGLGFVYIRP